MFHAFDGIEPGWRRDVVMDVDAVRFGLCRGMLSQAQISSKRGTAGKKAAAAEPGIGERSRAGVAMVRRAMPALCFFHGLLPFKKLLPDAKAASNEMRFLRQEGCHAQAAPSKRFSARQRTARIAIVKGGLREETAGWRACGAIYRELTGLSSAQL
jgi:hypothetical protein